MYTLETSRLGLRPIEESDLEFFAALHADPEVARYLGTGMPRTTEQARQLLARIMTAYATDGLGQLAVYRKDSGALVGRCGITVVEIEAEPESEPGTLPRWFWF